MWQSYSEKFSLPLSDIHLWKANLSIDQTLQAELWLTLSDEEKLRANRLKFPHLRVRYVAARGILRRLLSQYLSVSAVDIKINYGKQGKPFLMNFPNFKFNLSHSEDLAVFAFSKSMTLGIDVEYINKEIDIESIVPRFFSKNEAASVLGLTPDKRPAAFFNCWTRKEAFIKAKGGGLSIPLDQFEVSLLPGDTPEILAINWAPEEVKSWSVFSFNMQKGFVGALMTNEKVNQVSFLNF